MLSQNVSLHPAQAESTPKLALRRRGLGILTPRMDSTNMPDVERESVGALVLSYEISHDRAPQQFPSSTSYSGFGRGDGFFEGVASQLVSSATMPEGVGLGLKMPLLVESVATGFADASFDASFDTSYATEPDSIMPATPPDATPASRYPPPSPEFSVDISSVSLESLNFGTPEFTVPPPATRSMNDDLASAGTGPSLFDDVFTVRPSQSSSAIPSACDSLMTAAIDYEVSGMTFSEQDDYYTRRAEEQTSCDDPSPTSAGGVSVSGVSARLGLGLSMPTEPSATSIASSSSFTDDVSDGHFCVRPKSPVEDAEGFGGQDGQLRRRLDVKSAVGKGLPSVLGSLPLARTSSAAVNVVPRHAIGARQIFATRLSRPRSFLSPILEDPIQTPVSACLAARSEPLPLPSKAIVEGFCVSDEQQEKSNTQIPRPSPFKFWTLGHLFRGASLKPRVGIEDGKQDGKASTADSSPRFAKLWSAVRAGFKSLKGSPKTSPVVVHENADTLKIRPRAFYRTLF